MKPGDEQRGFAAIDLEAIAHVDAAMAFVNFGTQEAIENSRCEVMTPAQEGSRA